jgi:crotonobetaine/carnitine-CoA ligase
MSAGWEPVAFNDLWERAVEARRDAPFLRFEGPSGEVAEWTYGEFDGVVGRCAGLLTGHGVGPGDAIHLALTNSPAFIAVWLATFRLGAWMVPSDPMGAVPELTGHLRRTTPRLGFGSTARADVYRQAADDLPVVLVSEADTVLDVFGTDVVESGGCRVPARQRAAVMFTSGTTGEPKGVELTQANYAFTGMTMGEACGLRPEHRQLVVLPLFHANAQYYSVASAIWAGASVALVHTFSASGFLRQAADHGATHASLFAAPMRMILARSAVPAAPVGLQHCWYAMNITPEQHATLAGWFGCRPRQLYGMTETAPAVLTEPPTDPVPDAMGFPTAGCLVDLDGEELLVGGEPGVTLFAGYLDDAATTEASFRDRPDGSRWFVTGDKAHRDADGRYRFGGRRSDILKVAGENVSTVEVEQVLSAHPAVLEAAVVGAPDEVRDEVPFAFVVAADPAAPPTVDELVEWCSQRLTKSKRPRDIALVDELPRTSVGKIRKFLLTEAAADASRDRPSSHPGAPR